MALIERKVVLTEKDSSGNTVMNFPVTRAEYVEDAVLSVNGAKGAVTIGAASQSAQGLMSASDKAKLDGIATGANKYSLPTATASTKGGVTIGDNITVSSGTISLSKTNVTNALGYTPLQTAPVTSVNSKTGAVSLAASDVGALSTGGGTLSGGIAYSVDEIVSRTVDTGAAKFFSGSTSNNGASLILSGKSRPTFPGQFNLNACDGTTTTSLLGKADGTLTWGSKNVVRSVNGTNADANGNVTITVPTGTVSQKHKSTFSLTAGATATKTATELVANKPIYVFVARGATTDWCKPPYISKVTNVVAGSTLGSRGVTASSTKDADFLDYQFIPTGTSVAITVYAEQSLSVTLYVYQ